MDIQHLRAFVLLAQELHFAVAADMLDIAQPVLSRRIQDMERELGVSLFARTTRIVRLTAAGQAFLGAATEVIDAFDRAIRLAQRTSTGEMGRVSIAFAGASTHVLVGRLSQLVHEQLPGVTLELTSAQFAQPALDRVLKKEIDVALGRWEHVPAGVSVTTLAVEYLVVAVPIDHPLAHRDVISPQDLRDEPLVALPRHFGSVLTERLRLLGVTGGFVPKVIQEAPDSWTLISLVAAGIGCTVTLSSVQDNFAPAGVRFLPLSEQATEIYLRMAWLENSPNPALPAVVSLMEELIGPGTTRFEVKEAQ